MASTFPVQACVKTIAFLVKLLTPPPFLFLLLLLLLSLLLALALLHINELLAHSLSTPPLFHFLSPLHLDKQGFLSLLLHIQQHHLAFLLSPCSIFILANFIIFTLIFKSFYLSSSSSSSPLLDCSDFASEPSECDGACLPEHVSPSHEDFFLSSPPYQPYVLLSHDPPEEYHVLSFSDGENSTYYTNMQRYNKLNNEWENVRGKTVDPAAVEKTQSMLAVVAGPTPVPANYMLSVERGKVVEKAGALKEGRLDGKTSRSVNSAASASPGSQAVVINMELPPVRRTRISTPPPHPPAPTAVAPSQKAAKVALQPPNPSMPMAQRPLQSSPKAKKSLQSSGEFSITANDGTHEASKPLLEGEKQIAKHNKPQKKINDQNSMGWSTSDLRLSQQALSPEVTTALTSYSSTNRPQMQRAQSLRSSSSPDAITSSPSHMQRAQSLRSNGSDAIASLSQVTRSPSFSELVDGLSDADANKCFSDFIAHRFALMKKEIHEERG